MSKHISAFAFVGSSVLSSDTMCLSKGINESRGFTVKRRTVCIRIQHKGKTSVDLSDCKDIGDVVTKLNGNSVYCNNSLLQPSELLDDVIMRSQDDFFLYITSKANAPSFTFSHSVSAMANRMMHLKYHRLWGLFSPSCHKVV